METIKKLLAEERVEDAYILTRFMYRVGNPIIPDHLYDALETFCRNNGVAEEYVGRTYDDDPIPLELLQEFGYESYVPKEDLSNRLEYYRYLDEEKSLSVKPVTNYEDALDYFRNVRGKRLIMSLKMDGVFTKKLILDGEMKLGLSRGRSGNAFDLTDKIYKVLPRFYNTEGEVKVYSEFFVDPTYLQTLRDKYDKTAYKTEKSSAISLLRVEHRDEDYKYLRGYSFGAEGLDTTLSGSLEKLQDLGFPVVPHITIEPDEIPYEINEFKKWLKEKLDVMFKLGQGIPSDGVVVDVDDLLYFGEIKDQYSSRNVALKMEYWSFDYYKGVVTNILFEQRRVYASCRVEIEPLVTKDMTEARIVNIYNPKILVDNGIKVGSEIYFERNSGAINVLIRGEKLKSIETGG